MACVVSQIDDITRVARSSKIMERMVNQNTFDDIAQGRSFTWVFVTMLHVGV